MLLALLPVASAATTVLVSTLQPRNPEATGLAVLVENFLASELDEHPDLDVLRIDELPPYEDYTARVYMEGCPPGDIQGCTLVMGQRGKAAWAVTGTVQALVTGTRVTIDIVDVEGARTALSFTSELEAGSDEAFAAGVAKVLVAAIGGEFEEKDIRELDEEAPAQDDDAVARQLEELSRELGEVSAVVTRGDRAIERPKYTVEDLAKRAAQEGTTPWERIGMTAPEYLRWKNSGMKLATWRQRAMGRAGQVVVRPFGGFSRGPWAGEYYGRYAYDDAQVVDALSAQAVQGAGGATGGVAVAYGLHPVLDVGAAVSVVGGRYTVDVVQQIVGQPTGQRPPTSYQEATVLFGPVLTVAPVPTWTIRPVVGAGFLMGEGPGVQDKIQLPPDLVTWASPLLVFAQGFVGGEARLSDRVDVFAQVPVGVLVSGELSATERTGTQEVVETGVPGAASPVSAGFHVGLQLRLGGRKPAETSRVEEMDELEE